MLFTKKKIQNSQVSVAQLKPKIKFFDVNAKLMLNKIIITILNYRRKYMVISKAF